MNAKKTLTISLDDADLEMIETIQGMVPISKAELIRQALDAHRPEFEKMIKALKRAGLGKKP